MSRISKNYSLQIAAICAITVLLIGTTQFALAKDDSRIKLEGEFDSVDDGKVNFESRDGGDRKKFSVEIHSVQANAEFEMDAAGTTFSTQSDAFGVIDFNADTQCEDDGSDCIEIPNLISGDIVTVTGPDLQAKATLR